MRGEHSGVWRNLCPPSGSSPHARGTPDQGVKEGLERGIIPACAGNTDTMRPVIGENWDHPRMRGEHSRRPCTCGIRWGSSPHARGTQFCPYMKKAPFGIIPACAGNT